MIFAMKQSKKQQIIEMTNQGISAKRIANKLGTTQLYVRTTLTEAGMKVVPATSRIKAEERRQKFIDWRAKNPGKTLAAMARSLRWPLRRVYSIHYRLRDLDS